MDRSLLSGHMWSHPHSPELNANEATADLIKTASADKAGDLKRYEQEETTRSPLQEGGEGKDDADVIPAATKSDKNPFRSSQRSIA